MNYAHLLNQIDQYDTARLVLKDKLKVLQKRYGRTALESLPMYMEPEILACASEVFNQAALNTIRKFRYAPNFQHGAAVTTTNVGYKLYFGVPQGLP